MSWKNDWKLNIFARSAGILCVLVMVLAGMLVSGDGTVYAAGSEEATLSLKEEALVPEEDAAYEDIPEEDEMLELFLEKKTAAAAGTGAAASWKNGRGSKLSGNNRILYDVFRTEIEKIAAGKRSDTIIKVPLSRIVGSDLTITASELGLAEITGSKGALSDESYTALSSYVDYDLETIFQALLIDLPYDLYWFDKTAGLRPGTLNISYTFTSSKIVFRKDYNYSFVFSVSGDYSTTGQNSTSVDTAKTAAAAAAAKAAGSIISSNSSRPDCEKLDAYRAAICSLASYNHSAIDTSGNQRVPYGDPWQLIYVFDGDASTAVVCEGYAKAFQFLCDNSEFADSSVECRTVTGTMTGGTGAGGHMWNVVHMDDGMNYLVDVTNCDSGAAGTPDQLFLRGAFQGSLSDGYMMQCVLGSNASYLHYSYDTSTRSLYSARELIIRGKDYGTEVTAAERKELADAKDSIEYARKSIANARITGIGAMTCTGKAVRPSPVVRVGGIRLVKGRDYTVSYSRNKNVGTASVTVKGINNYKGKITRKFVIRPAGTSIRRIKAGNKSFRITWKKISRKMTTSRITGYQIQAATDNRFTKNRKSIKVKGYARTSATLSGLRSGVSYYLRIRTYKIVSGKTYYSDWTVY